MDFTKPIDEVKTRSLKNIGLVDIGNDWIYNAPLVDVDEEQATEKVGKVEEKPMTTFEKSMLAKMDELMWV